MPDDFTNLWRNQATDDKPKTTIIGNLQRLLEQKNEEINALKKEKENLKSQLNQDVELLNQTEQVIGDQKKKIDSLTFSLEEAQIQLQVNGKNTSGKSTFTGRSSASSKMVQNDEEVKELNAKVKSLEDRLYIMSTLPDRIATLEEQRRKDLVLIEEFEEREKTLRQKIKSLSSDSESAFQLEIKEEELQKLKKENANLLKQVDDLENQLISPAATLTANRESQPDVDASVWQERFEKAKTQYEKAVMAYRKIESDFSEAKNKIKQLESEKNKIAIHNNSGSEQKISNLNKELETLKNQLMTVTNERDKLKSDYLTETISKKGSDSNNEINNLTKELNDVKDKLNEAHVQYENLLFKYQESQKRSSGGAEQSLIEELTTNLEKERSKSKKLQRYISELKGKRSPIEVESSPSKETDKPKLKLPPSPKAPPTLTSKTSNGSPLQELVNELNMKIEKQKKTISSLKDENEKYKSSTEKLNKIDEIVKENDTLKKKVDELSTSKMERQPTEDIESIKAENESLKKENLELQEKLKPTSSKGQENLLLLINDLQDKINKLKKENSKLNEQIKSS